jgi:outer membrane protein assembly factor BamB
VFFCSGNDLFALKTSDGSTIWHFHSANVVRTGVDFCSLPVVSNGVVYIAANDGSVYAFDASTGVTIWNHPLGTYPFYVGLGDGNVYVGDSNQDFLALDAATGNQVWKLQPGANVAMQPVVANGYVYFGLSFGFFYVLGAQDQSLLWGFTLGGGGFSNSLTLAP